MIGKAYANIKQRGPHQIFGCKNYQESLKIENNNPGEGVSLSVFFKGF